MWPWRPRTPIENLGLPNKCFISHSYKDAEALQRLLTLLPNSVEPYIFPPIVVPPEQMVSDALVAAILDHDGMIYLQGGASELSFWVAFERDYAQRAGKVVFGYDPHTDYLQRDIVPAMHLPVFISHSHRDDARVAAIQAFMRRERYFDTLFDQAVTFPGFGMFQSLISRPLESRLRQGGYVVVFWSAQSEATPWTRTDIRLVAGKYTDRILLALLDDSPLPDFAAGAPVVQIYGDAERSERQRLDDLIVHLYWLIYRNTGQNQLS